MSWGRHGWPRKDEGLRIYRERDGSYMLIEPDDRTGGNYGAIANALEGPGPSLCTTSVSADFLYTSGCKRVQWDEVPKEWQRAIRPWLTKKPKEYRGFWLVGKQPA